MNTPPLPNQPKKSTPWVLIVVCVIALLCLCPVGLFVIGGLNVANSKEFKDAMNNVEVSTSNAPTTATVTEKPPYKIEDLKGTDDYITGTLTNQSGEKKGYVQVEINLLDKSDAVVGSTLANVNNLEVGQKWKFKAVVFGTAYDHFKVKGVTGF